MKHKQHYVWKHYLSSWADNDKVFCLRGSDLFRPNIIGTAQKRDFYRTQPLNKDDITLISNLINKFPSHLQELQRETLRLFLTPHFGKELIEEQRQKNTDDVVLGALKALDCKIDVIINNLEEEMHSEIESNSIKYLDYIRAEDISFWDNSEDRLEFLHFLAIQMLRTKKTQDKLFEAVDTCNASPDTLKNTWGVMRHLLSLNVSDSLYRDPTYKLTLLLNEGAVPFITSDQPVINTFSVAMPKLPIPINFEIYYPVTPRKAILVSKTNDTIPDNTIFLNENEVRNYNNFIFEESHEQIYSGSEAILRSFIR